MRLSVIKNDPGYQPDAYNYEVFLDGERIQHCFTADTDQGLVWVYYKGKYAKQRILKGKVKIVKHHNWGVI